MSRLDRLFVEIARRPRRGFHQGLVHILLVERFDWDRAPDFDWFVVFRLDWDRFPDLRSRFCCLHIWLAWVRYAGCR